MSSFLHEILSDSTEQEFLRAYDEKIIFHSAGFNDLEFLFPWSVVNEILTSNQLSFPRIRFFKDGKLLSKETYSKVFKHRRREIALLDQEVVNGLLSDGATVVINGVDELYQPLRKFSQNCREFFSKNITVNAYLSFGEVKGFNPHWDDHDVIILQVYGRKEWWVSPDDWKFPLPENFSPNLAPPKHFEWNDIIGAGGLLYVPRGWWHYACALGEPSLHLTIGIDNNTGMDFLKWIAEKASSIEFFRREIPDFSIENRKKYYQKFKSTVYDLLETCNIEAYQSQIEKEIYGVNYHSWPWSVSRHISLPKEFYFGVRPILGITSEADGKTIKVTSYQKEWLLSVDYKSLLDILKTKTKWQSKEFYALNMQEKFSKEPTIALKELLIKGIIYLQLMEK